MYALLKSYKRFEFLSTFTLASGTAEAERVRNERKASKKKKRSPGDASSSSPPSQDVSEKVKGKRPERDGVVEGSAASSLNDEDEEEARQSTDADERDQVFVGKNGFVPTEGWVSSWRTG